MFVCGLHRSGTSVLARNIGKLQDCTIFSNTGVREDEGQYLQDVYPIENSYGGPGRFGFHPRAHLNEASELLTASNIAKLHESWHSHWDPSKLICIEKTPGNLLMTRFLQRAFQNSYFIVIKRHPVATSLATQKWSMTSLHNLFEHWLRCYLLFESDKKFLKNVYELTYEEYVESPTRFHQEIAAFIGTNTLPSEMEPVIADRNKAYLSRWADLLEKSRFKTYYNFIANVYESQFSTFNYSLFGPAGLLQTASNGGNRLDRAMGAVFCGAADTITSVWRLHGRRMESMSKAMRSHAPECIKDAIKQVLCKAPLHGLARLLMPRWAAGIDRKRQPR